MIVYKATNKINGKEYIGQTARGLDERMREHINCALSNKDNWNFYNAIRKYGPDNFKWSVLERCNSIVELNEKECLWIDSLNTLVPSGYNLQSGGMSGLKHEETKKKMSESAKGRILPESIRQKISESHKGKELSEEHRNKISKSLEGRKRSEEHRKNLSKALKGRKFSKEHKENLSRANRGKKVSEETKRKKSIAVTGNRNPFYGRKHSEKTKALIGKKSSERMKKYWSSKRKNEK